MNDRERFITALRFGKPDKIPFEPGYPRESTLAAWHQQGLPVNREWYKELEEILGFQFIKEHPYPDLGVVFTVLPIFVEKVLEHRNGHYIVQDWMGAITEISDEYDYTYIRSAKDFVTRKWHRFPVQKRQDWEEKIRWRYDIQSAGRFPADFEQRRMVLQERDYPLHLTVSGPFWQMREWCGLENLCILMKDEPFFVQQMVDFWKNFVLQMLDKIIQTGIVLDYFQVSEDMAYKMHSMISPAMIRRYLMPVWKEWNFLVRSSGCQVISIDSDGYIGELIPLWVEAGFNHNWPVEVAAGNDIVAYRRQYGKKMAYGGGIDKRALAAGGEVMRDELLRVVPPLLVEGGFIPGCDHGVPPDISWDNFISYSKFLAQSTGWL